jgi:microcystin-dependent protein
MYPGSPPDGVRFVEEYANPVGTIIAFYGTAAPNGYFACNGQSFSQVDYPELYTVLGSNVLPDLAGKFLRGVGGNSAALGVAQGDAIRNIAGPANLYIYKTYDIPNTGIVAINDGYMSLVLNGQSTGTHYLGNGTINVSRSGVPTAPENRPVNVAVTYCIKHDW